MRDLRSVWRSALSGWGGLVLVVLRVSAQTASEDGGVGERALRQVAAAVTAGQTTEGEPFEAEGIATLVSEHPGGLELELTSGTGRLRVKVADKAGLSPALLLNSRIRVRGVRRSAWTLDGQSVPRLLEVSDRAAIEQLELAPKTWTAYSRTTISNLLRADFEAKEGIVVRVAGRIQAVESDRSLVIEDATANVRVQTLQKKPQVVGDPVEVLAQRSRTGTNVVLENGFCRETAQDEQAAARLPRVLVSAGEIKHLKREEALRGHPVRIRGVVTCVQTQYQAMVIQDSTLGIYVKNCPFEQSEPAQVGEFWEVEGVTDAGFAPMVRPWRVVRLGEGMLPDPVYPTWDQLMNGSLDTQYVELEGIVIAIQFRTLMLLTRGGKIQVRLPDLDPATFAAYEGSLVKCRGCLFARHEDETVALEVKIGEVELHSPLISVVERPPRDLFATPMKRAVELLLFDPQAGAFQRVRVGGQVLHVREGTGYLMDGSNGLRFVSRENTDLEPSDLVQLVGFSELGGPSPLLREAVVRKVGRAALPAAKELSPANLLRMDYDSTLVQVEGVLVNLTRHGREQILELETGRRKFVARLAGEHRLPDSMPYGSRLRLSGVYAGLGGNRAAGREIDAFELLMNSAADIRVLETPSWWTLKHTLAVAGVLAGGLVVALVWITMLHLRVEYRTTQLRQQILERERAEQQHALEEERSRIARDLHDDLGSSLTEIGMLAETGRYQPAGAEDPRQRFDRILARARTLVRTLDEIVWAVDPRKDTLAALLRYLGGFAEEYSSTAGLACRVEVPSRIPERPLAARVRHHLFLAVKEALHNAVRHAHASEVAFRIDLVQEELQVTVADNGRGFDPVSPSEGNGLANLRERLAGLGGRCEVRSRTGAGTTVLLALSLTRNTFLS
ncbi:MAG TPA: sensor histidine kinase [Verrucomicrobiae bacterium]